MSVSRLSLVAISVALLTRAAVQAEELGKALPVLPPIPAVPSPAAGPAAIPGEIPPAPSGGVAPHPAAIGGPAIPQSGMPPDFWSWQPADQLKWLQARLTVLGLVKDFVDTNQKIREASRSPMPAGPVPTSAPVVVQGSRPSAAPAEPLPVALKIYQRNGRRVADLMVPGQGMRTVQAGSRLADGMNVVDITGDDVLVTVDRKPIALPANLGASPGPAPQPAAGVQPVAPPRGADSRGRPDPVSTAPAR